MEQLIRCFTVENAAFIVAFMALVFTIWQFFVQRNHNKLSVEPLFKVEHNWEGNTRSICIINCGLGPAIISELSLSHKGKDIAFNAISEKYDLAEEHIEFGGFYSYGKTIDKAYIIDKGEELHLLSLWFHEDHGYNDAREKIFKFLKETNLTINYESIYKEKHNLSVSLYSNIDHRHV